MSGRDDDLLDVDDLRTALGRVLGWTRTRPIAVGIVLSVVAASLALGLVPHVLGAVGADAVDTGAGPSPGGEAGDGAQQRYQNYLTNLAFLFAPVLLPLVGVGVAFAGALRVRESRASRVGIVSASAAVGVALGYVAFVGVGHLAFGAAPEGYIVEQYPVTLRFGALAVNALALGALSGVGGALAGVAGALVEPHPGAGDVDEAASLAADVLEDEGASGVDAADDRADDAHAAAEASGETSESGETAETDESPAERPTRLDGASPASDYQDAGGQYTSDTPTYDPADRNWDGSGEDSS
jgi:hypothetical protein